MRRAFPLILGLLAVVGVTIAVVALLRDQEDDGRSPYEKTFGDEPFAPAVSFACFPRRPHEGAIAALNESAGIDALVPGEPERLLLCRYRGQGHGERSLRVAKRRLVTDPATVGLIADGLNELPPFPDGEFACPSDEGARTYALFAYPDDPPVVVELRSEGCPAARNGWAPAARLGDPVARQVADLVPLSARRAQGR